MRMTVSPPRIRQNNRGNTSVGATQTSQPITFPAPTAGLITTTDLASQSQGAASVLENWLPTLTGARIRGGSMKQGLAAGGQDIITAFKYVFGSVERLFMATATAIFDMSAPAAPPATTPAVVSDLTSGDWCTFQHTNAGDSYLVCMNGTDPRLVYDGTAWGTAPDITFSDSTTMANLSYGWVFKNRQFLIKAGSLDAYYLTTVNAVGGAASVFPLAGVFTKGGTLLCGFSWSIESGNGPNEYCCFMTTEGEVAAFAGANPGDANDFSKVGVYQIGRPLGKNALIKFGGDVLIATVDGLIPLSQAFNRATQDVSLAALSRAIDTEWRAASNATEAGWTLTLWPEENLVFVAFPDNPAVPDTTFVMHAQTKKWSIITNWRASCYAEHQKSIFFGGPGGYCWHGDYTGTDDGLTFRAAYLSSFNSVGGFGQSKTASLASMFLRASDRPLVRLFARGDFDRDIPSYSVVSTNVVGTSVWDIGQWDVAVWDGGGIGRNLYKIRQNVRAEGEMLAIGCVILSSGEVKLDVEIDLGVIQASSGLAAA